MDFKRRGTSNLDIRSRKLKTKLIVFRDKHFNLRSILKLILPIVIVAALMPLALYFLVTWTYQRRTITTPQEIPLELRTGVVMLRQEDILYDFDNARQLINQMLDLYTKKRVTQVFIIAYNDNRTVVSSIEPFEQFFKDIPTDNYKIDISAKNIFEACNTISEKYQTQKFLLTSYRNVLPRMSYACNVEGQYVKPYLPREYQFTTQEDDFKDTLDIILKSIFPNTQE
ncbi:hypothetical protein DOJK_00812 [Patescibacteria group bacterium]|nr:hypothetical protein [Candidatus Dojkabacteria bacterium]CAG1021150.1 hypothetical protein DOJK_00812 [Patescibacteria group bacterium]